MDAADRLISFVDASPTPFHACATAAERLRSAGFSEVDPRDPWPTEAGRHFIVTGGTLVAWSVGPDAPAAAGFRIVGAHTDSPNLRLKQHHDGWRSEQATVALEPYGGPLLESWLDLDLGIAGRVVLRDGTTRLVRIDEPLLRVPRLAIHLDRDGSKVDRQRHLDAISGLTPQPFLEVVGERAGFAASDVTGFDLMTFDLRPAARTGVAGELVAAPRLDNQATCSAAVAALLGAVEAADPAARQVMVLFDHEEVGSTSERGADSPLLSSVLERIVLAAGGSRDDVFRAVAASVCVSGDMAHATHPNQPDKHEPLHRIALGGGPVLKVNQNLRYATDGVGAGLFAAACEAAGVPLQRYVHRADLPCGSTIGPISAARTGILTVDVGAPQLAMHSAREVMAAADVDAYGLALGAFLTST
ncbi:M18 family aminopeptidase [Aeromicrobium sp. 636]|uniref:M18 family aminopeptidase n=1 Tax=Aeromicrobium senzhongii TaxID=2663859 RepID=A0A8I0K1Q4_9ACTN|nr:MULTISPECIES: M18 family aminopeptidase [Aeromicrobium]MBC9224845.1 M18 family aminopeptidase [Aeromicrobium senzhongii]MCQ3996958.1 M18 family aminopeptidase [Aeromicrobium sp. 636]